MPQGDILHQGEIPPQSEIGGLRRWNTLREPQGDMLPRVTLSQGDITFNTFPIKCEFFFLVKELRLIELKNSYISVKKLTLMKNSIIPMRMRIT